MKTNFLFATVLVLMMVGLFNSSSVAQNPTYTCTFANDSIVAADAYEFDIYLLRTGSIPFELAQWQGGILYNNAIKNGGTLIASWVPGSVDSQIVLKGQQNTAFNTATAGVIKIAAKLPSTSTDGAIISNVAPGSRVGRLRLVNSLPFATLSANIAWNFTASPYPSKVFAYIPSNPPGGPDVNTDITTPATHLNVLSNLPLPVELVAFTANLQQRDILLNWKTQTEVNSRLFEIERQNLKDSKAGEWKTIGSVNSAGTSTVLTEYSYTDKKLNSGKYNYRLKIIDNDGTYEYSDAVETEIELPKDFAISQNYPNPFNPTTRIDYQLPFDSKVTLELYGITGERIATLINNELSAGYYTADINASALNLASGVYIYRMSAQNPSGQNFVQVKKLMLTK